MVNNRMTEGVGKKIVDALKKQTDVEIMPQETVEDVSIQTKNIEEPVYNEPMPPFDFLQDGAQGQKNNIETSNDFMSIPTKTTYNFGTIPEKQQAPSPISNETFTGNSEVFELPANVEVLRQLIAKIPSNVSKQTGAQIIKQTMEALGISMKSVLQEAQAVQENLNASARECQNSIAECRKQIGLLENQTQKIHRQYSMLNDIISLFIQAGN